MSKRTNSPLHDDAVDPHSCTLETRLAMLRRTPLFHGLDDAALAEVNRRFRTEDYRAGETIYRAGNDAEKLYVVATGKVRLLEYTAEGQAVLQDLLAPGEVFGSLYALGDEAYASDAEAQTFCCLLSLAAESFLEVLREVPAVALTALELTAERLHEARRLQVLSTRPVEQRLAATLLKLAEKLGDPTPQGLVLQSPLSQGDLAAMTGTTPESVNRALRSFKERGLVESGRGWLALQDERGLAAVAEVEG